MTAVLKWLFSLLPFLSEQFFAFVLVTVSPMASGGMHYMMPKQACSSVDQYAPASENTARFPDKCLTRAWAVDFLGWQLHQISWPNVHLATLSYCRRLHLLSEPQMWRTIIRGCAQQFHGQMDLECRHHAGVSIRQIQEILSHSYDIHDCDESLDDNESLFSQTEELVE